MTVRKAAAALAVSTLCCMLLSGCATEVRPCPMQSFVGVSQMADFADDDSVPFRFPLDDAEGGAVADAAHFCASARKSETLVQYHAAEDYHLPAGTPVYAIADGEVGYSGKMGGYGWLVIVDHPDANLYSLYGHLSPSSWTIEKGPVSKGDLLGYLGHETENGGSEEEPLVEHLHLGIRAGQMGDYSGMGEWRWMAGWIKPCPTDLGWLHPSKVISEQEIPEGGFITPERPLLEAWGMELGFSLLYLVAVPILLASVIKKDQPFTLLPMLVALSVGGVVISLKGARLSYVLFALTAVVAVFGVWFLFVHRRRLQGEGCDASERRQSHGPS